MLDQSMPVEEGGAPGWPTWRTHSRRGCRCCRRTPRWGCGRSTASQGRSEVQHRSAVGSVDGGPRSAALTAALRLADRLGRRRGVVHHAAAGLHRSVGEIPRGPEQFGPGHHDGPHTDRVAGRPGLQHYIQGAFERPPVAVNVIDFGDDSDRATWEAVAQASGGSYQNLSTSASSELSSAIATMLGSVAYGQPVVGGFLARTGSRTACGIDVTTRFGPVWYIAGRTPMVRSVVNRTLINRLIYTMPTRPLGLSTLAGYRSWPGLTDRDWSARHLPEAPGNSHTRSPTSPMSSRCSDARLDASRYPASRPCCFPISHSGSSDGLPAHRSEGCAQEHLHP